MRHSLTISMLLFVAIFNLVLQRTEVDVSNKALNTFSVPTTVVDLGKQLLQYARDGDLKGVKNMLSRGAPFTSDWVRIMTAGVLVGLANYLMDNIIIFYNFIYSWACLRYILQLWITNMTFVMRF